MDTNVQLTNGMTVRGSDGEKVGTVAGFDGQYMVVEKGFFFPSDHYIPTSAISSVGDDEVYLAVTKDDALNQGWDRQPEGWVAERSYATGPDADYVATGGEALRVPVYEEDIAARTRDVERGAVRVEKDVVAEDRVMDVPLTEERVRVSRVDTVSDAPVGDDAFREGVIEVPLRGQEVDIAKTARKTGEVIVEKEAETRTERVGGTVRREEVRVEDDTLNMGLVDDATTQSLNRPSRAERNRERKR